MAGPKTEGLKSTEAAQTDIGKTQTGLSKEDVARRNELLKYGIDFNTAIASGDPNAIGKATSPMTKLINDNFKTANASAFNRIPAGAARDFSLATLGRDKAGAVSAAQVGTYLGSFDKLAQAGTAYGGWATQEGGLGLTGYSEAGKTQSAIAQAEQARKNSIMQGITGLAGVAGTVMTGGASGGNGLFSFLSKKTPSSDSIGVKGGMFDYMKGVQS